MWPNRPHPTNRRHTFSNALSARLKNSRLRCFLMFLARFLQPAQIARACLGGKQAAQILRGLSSQCCYEQSHASHACSTPGRLIPESHFIEWRSKPASIDGFTTAK
jgi:hypothetical protein